VSTDDGDEGMSELKRCPFCGSNSVMNSVTGDISCKDCGANSHFDWNYRPIEDELNAKIVQLTAERDGWIARNARQEQHFDKFMIEHHELQNECAEWWQDAERLAKYFIWVDGEYGIYTCIHCDTEGEYTGGLYQDILEEQVVITHSDTCPITLHRALVEKYKKEVVR
jgi:ribosomal protein L37AE/L43A